MLLRSAASSVRPSGDAAMAVMLEGASVDGMKVCLIRADAQSGIGDARDPVR